MALANENQRGGVKPPTVNTPQTVSSTTTGTGQDLDDSTLKSIQDNASSTYKKVNSNQVQYSRDGEGNLKATLKNPVTGKPVTSAVQERDVAGQKKYFVTEGRQTIELTGRSVQEAYQNRNTKLTGSTAKVKADGSGGNTGQDPKINEKSEKEEIRDNTVEGANKVRYDLNVVPSFIKSYSIYEQIPTPFIQVNFLTISGLPAFNEIGYRDNEVALTQVVPPNLIKSFEHDVAKNTATLEIEDTTLYEGELIMTRINIAMQQLKRVPGFRITYGWTKPDRKLSPRLGKKFFPTMTQDFTIENVKTKTGKNSTTYTFALGCSPDKLPVEKILTPYRILGGKPLTRLTMFKLVEEVIKFFGDNGLAESGGTLSVGLQQRLIEAIAMDSTLSSYFGRDARKIQDFVLSNSKKFYDEFYQKYEKILASRDITNKKTTELFKIFTHTWLDYSFDSSSTKDENQNLYLTWLETIGQNGNLLSYFGHLTEDDRIPGINALRFCINSLIVQRESLVRTLENREQVKDIPVVTVINLFDEKRLLPAEEGFDPVNLKKSITSKDKTKDQEIAEEKDNALYGLKSGSIDCTPNQSWGDLISLLCKKIYVGKKNINTGKLEFNDKKNLQVTYYTIPISQQRFNEDGKLVDDASDRTYQVFEVLANQFDENAVKEKDSGKATAMREASVKIKKEILPKLKSTYETAKKYNLRYITYIVISEDSFGSVLDYSQWGSSILQKYTTRPSSQIASSNRGYFDLGGRSLLDHNLPDVIDYDLGDFDIYNAIAGFYTSTFTEAEHEISNQKIVPTQEILRVLAQTTKLKNDVAKEKNKNAKTEPDKADDKKTTSTLSAMDEFKKKAKLKYPIMMPAFNQPFIHQNPNEVNLQALEVKKNLNNMRRRLLYTGNLSGLQPTIVVPGEPYYQNYAINKRILWQHVNPDSSFSFLTGIYILQNMIHKIGMGRFTTDLVLARDTNSFEASELIDALIDDTINVGEF